MPSSAGAASSPAAAISAPQTTDIVTAVCTVLRTAAAIRARYPDVSFYFHGGDAVAVVERLILHRRQGLQRRIAAWAQTDVEKLNIAATYNVINGNPEAFVKSGIGAFLTVRELLSSRIDDGVCFRPLYPALTERHMLVWKRSAALSRAARVFLDAARTSVEA